MNCTGSMWKTNVGWDPERVVRKVSPAVEVVTHCGLDGKLSSSKCGTSDINFHFVIVEQLHESHDHPAAFTIVLQRLAAMLVSAH